MKNCITITKGEFTVADLKELHPDFISITLRVRLTQWIESNQVKEIGIIERKGKRPAKVFQLS